MALRYNCPNCSSHVTVLYLEPGQIAKCKICGVNSEVAPDSITVRAEAPSLVSETARAGDTNQLGQQLRQFIRTNFVYYAAGTILLIFLGAIGLFAIEYDTFADSVAGHVGKDLEDITKWDTFLHTVWWSIVTFTTVGYGDVSPASHFGKIFGIVILFASYVWTILLSGFVASLLVTAALKETDELDEDKYKGHTIIAGWNPMVEEILRVMQREEETKPVVIGSAPLIVLVNEMDREEISRGIENFDRLDITLLPGRYTQEAILKKALIEQAGNLIIVPDRTGLSADQNADENVIMLTAMTVRGISEQVQVIAHLTDPELKPQLENINCEVVLTDDYTSELIAGHITQRGIPQMIDEVIRIAGDGYQFTIVQIPPLLADSTHQEVFNYFRQHRNALLMGYAVQRVSMSLDASINQNGSAVIREMIAGEFRRSGINTAGSEHMELELNPSDDYQVDSKHRCILLMSGEDLNPSQEA